MLLNKNLELGNLLICSKKLIFKPRIFAFQGFHTLMWCGHGNPFPAVTTPSGKIDASQQTGMLRFGGQDGL